MAGTTAVVLAGGASHRMGGDKRMLRLFPTSPTFLERTVALGRLVADRAVVVGGPEATSPYGAVTVLVDRWPGEGPLGALVTALDAFPEDRVVVLASDYPMLQVGLVARTVAALDGHEAAIAVGIGGGVSRTHPLVGAYDAGRSARTAREFFEAGERSMRALLARLTVRQVGEDEGVDPEVHRLSLTNVNTPGELDALRLASAWMDAWRR